MTVNISVSVDNLNLENVKAALLSAPSNLTQLLFPEETPLQVKTRLLQGKESAQLIKEIREEGEKLLQETMPELTYSLFRLFSTIGSRREYEIVYFQRRNRLTTFGLLAWLDGADSPYLDALSDTIGSILNEYTWCLPAHILHGPEMRSAAAAEEQYAAEGLVNRSAETFTIDLFAAETAFALSEISALLDAALPQFLRVRIREEVLRRILRPFVTQAPSHWETATHNWAAVCGGSIAAAAIYTLQDENELAAVLVRAFPALASYLSGFEEDGACTEGYMYWQYGFGYFTYAADLILRRTEGAVNWFQADKVQQIALFQQKSFLHGRKVVNFSDSQGEAGIFMGLSGYLKRLYPGIEHPELSLRAGFRDDHCSRWAPALRNLLWAVEDVEGSAWHTAAYYLPDAQWLVSRQLQEQGAYVFAAKGGHNNEPHNHNDIGHFMLYAQGETLLPDLGSGQYSRKYFGPERYDILCNSSQSHSVPIIDGLYQAAGAEHRAEVRTYSSNEAEDVFELEISSAYDTNKLTELVRRFIWNKTEPPTLEVTDSYEFIQAPIAVVERFMAWHRPVQAEDGRIFIEASPEAKVFLSYDHDLFDWEVVALDHVNHSDQPQTCYALDFKLKPGELSDSNLKVHAAFKFAFQ